MKDPSKHSFPTVQIVHCLLLTCLFAATGCEQKPKPENQQPAEKVTVEQAQATTAAVTAAATTTPQTAGQFTSPTGLTAAAATTTPISDDLLERYVGAYIKLSTLEKRTQAKLDEAGREMDIEKIERLQRDAKFMAKAILSEAGLSQEQYTDIRHRIKVDPELDRRGKKLFDRYMANTK